MIAYTCKSRTRGARYQPNFLMNLQPDQTVTVSIENSKIVIEPVRSTQKYTLDRLLEEEIEEDEEVTWGKTEGEEVW